jgi:hypothetical protein
MKLEQYREGIELVKSALKEVDDADINTTEVIRIHLTSILRAIDIEVKGGIHGS